MADTFKPFQLVYNREIPLGVVILGPIEIPFFEDGVASNFCKVPLNFTDPKEWERTFTGYIIWDIINEKYVIHSALHPLNLFEEVQTNGFVPFDHATSKLRNLKGLIELAKKCYNDPKFNFKLE